MNIKSQLTCMSKTDLTIAPNTFQGDASLLEVPLKPQFQEVSIVGTESL